MGWQFNQFGIAISNFIYERRFGFFLSLCHPPDKLSSPRRSVLLCFRELIKQFLLHDYVHFIAMLANEPMLWNLIIFRIIL